MGTSQIKIWSVVQNRVETLQIKMCSYVQNRMGTPHIKRCRFCGAIWRFSAPKIAKNRQKSGPKIAELMQIGAENRQKLPKIMPKWCKSSPTFGKGVNCAWHCSKETILDYVHIIFFFFYWNHLLVPKIVILARFSAPKIVKQYPFSAPNEANSATA